MITAAEWFNLKAALQVLIDRYGLEAVKELVDLEWYRDHPQPTRA